MTVWKQLLLLTLQMSALVLHVVRHEKNNELAVQRIHLVVQLLQRLLAMLAWKMQPATRQVSVGRDLCHRWQACQAGAHH